VSLPYRLDMRVILNFLVGGDQRALIYSSGSHNHLVSRVAVKLPGQTGRFDSDVGCERQNADARITQRLLEPLLEIAGKFQAFVFDEFGDFPERNRANAQALVLTGKNRLALRFG